MKLLTASGLASNPRYVLGHKNLNHNYGGVLSFAMKPTAKPSVSFFDKFKLVSRSGRLVKFTSRSNSKPDTMKLTPASTALEAASKLSALKILENC
jgi:O-acetylhomoserine/O-acetylserine sulfhydrylase-like pyridoxal-dependent enzyme